MWKYWAGALVVLVAIGGAIFWLQTPHYTNYPPQAGPILAFGDSLISGTGSTEGKDLPSRLSERLGEPVLNFGAPGDTTAEALARVDEALALRPRIAIVLLGGNDYLKRLPREETFQNLAAIIDKFQAQGAVVVLLGVRGGLLVDNFQKEYERLARAKGALYVSDVLDGLIGNRQVMFDQIHPNDEGYLLIAERVFKAMTPILK